MVRGRRSLEKEVFWREHVERQAAGGGAIRQYCRDHGLSEPSFYTWRRELRIRDGECSTTDRPATGLVAVDVVDSADLPTTQATLEIATAEGIVIRLREEVAAETLERVLGVVCRHSGAVRREETEAC